MKYIGFRDIKACKKWINDNIKNLKVGDRGVKKVYKMSSVDNVIAGGKK